MKDSKAVRLIASAYDEGQHAGFAEGCAYVRAEYEGDSAWVKSRAYEAGYAQAQEEAHKVGYQRGLAEGQARGSGKALSDARTLELMKEAREAGREQVLDELPKLTVWFMPCGKSKFEMQNGKPVLVPQSYNPAKLDGIKAIRWAYGSSHEDGYGLKEVKDLVEIEPGTFVSCGEPLPQSKAVELYLLIQAAGFEVVLRKP